MYKDVKGNKKKEKELLKPMWKLMDEADIIIGQNSNSFDIKKLNAKFLEYKLGSPSEYKKIDTMLMAKRHFKFVSNKLEYMSKKFCKVKKLAHSKFPGFSLWDECEKGNSQAWKEMRLYNMADVEATEELFLVLSEFDKSEVVTDALRAYRSK
jgi:DNA polymerase elongation subunit (family B)